MKAKINIDGIIFHFDQTAASKLDKLMMSIQPVYPAKDQLEISLADYFLDVLKQGKGIIREEDIWGFATCSLIH